MLNAASATIYEPVNSIYYQQTNPPPINITSALINQPTSSLNFQQTNLLPINITNVPINEQTTSSLYFQQSNNSIEYYCNSQYSTFPFYSQCYNIKNNINPKSSQYYYF